MSVVNAVNLLVSELLLGVNICNLELENPVDHIDRNAEPIDMVVNRKLQRRIDVAPLLVASIFPCSRTNKHDITLL